MDRMDGTDRMEQRSLLKDLKSLRCALQKLSWDNDWGGFNSCLDIQPEEVVFCLHSF